MESIDTSGQSCDYRQKEWGAAPIDVMDWLGFVSRVAEPDQKKALKLGKEPPWLGRCHRPQSRRKTPLSEFGQALKSDDDRTVPSLVGTGAVKRNGE